MPETALSSFSSITEHDESFVTTAKTTSETCFGAIATGIDDMATTATEVAIIEATTSDAAITEIINQASTTTAEPTTSLPPMPTAFKMVVRAGTAHALAARWNGQQVLVGTIQFLPSFTEASISYDEETKRLSVNKKPLCVMYEPIGYVAALLICDMIGGQYFYLTCERPSDTSVECSILGIRCNSNGCTEIG
ncbi:hypothetical protein FBEOM_511 [Fusarium beomiforme]|uniref:Uncharacterized protein n=1 Tax=Fusarium beomiforme TaxID=44412 RepID=A0A9P5AV42_9HYPO|nr:hypothetical protein FBEOM_511 [Fusarium beomiforme]